MKSKIKRLFHQVFLIFVTVWVGGWLFLLPWGIQNSDEWVHAENIHRECFVDGNSATEAQDCVKFENAEHRWGEDNLEIPELLSVYLEAHPCLGHFPPD
ncbi:MAG: hypothetical protein WAM58_21690 [Candidatus Acidiferrum sp.]